MKDYKQEHSEEKYGSLVEEILCEVFHIEDQDESLDYISEDAIYDLRSDEEIAIHLSRELDQLNEESASIDDLKTLEEQANSYFKNPTRVFTPKDEISNVEVVTGYIQINAGIKFDSNGNPQQIWKSYGQKLVIDVERILNPESILKQVESLGFSITEIVRVVFYGAPLESIVGSREYSKGEKKHLEVLDTHYPNILLAIPEPNVRLNDESIFDFVEERVKSSIQTGGPLGLDRVTVGHWELTHTRLQELKLESVEEKQLIRIQKIQASFAKRKQSYNDNFKEARCLIKQLNSGAIQIKDLIDLEAKALNQIIYLCKRDDCLIENPVVYFQVDALAKRKTTLENSLLIDQESVNLISKINSGNHIDVHLLSFEELDGMFKVLWSSTGIRISKEYKSTYFSLKERYIHLKNVARKRAA